MCIIIQINTFSLHTLYNSGFKRITKKQNKLIIKVINYLSDDFMVVVSSLRIRHTPDLIVI